MNAEHGFYPFLSGERIYLREVRLSDVNEDYYSWMNAPEITQYLESRFTPYSMTSLEEYVESKLVSKDEIFLAVVRRENDKHIGNIKLGPINWIHRIGDIGILIGDKGSWGQGFGSEAVILVAQYAFNTLNLHKVTAGCYEMNKGAIRAFEKAGFVVEGVRKSHCFCQGKYVDTILLGRINEREE